MTDTDIEIECPGCGRCFIAPLDLIDDVGRCAACGSDVPVRPVQQKNCIYKTRTLVERFADWWRLWRAQS